MHCTFNSVCKTPGNFCRDCFPLWEIGRNCLSQIVFQRLKDIGPLLEGHSLNDIPKSSVVNWDISSWPLNKCGLDRIEVCGNDCIAANSRRFSIWTQFSRFARTYTRCNSTSNWDQAGFIMNDPIKPGSWAVKEPQLDVQIALAMVCWPIGAVCWKSRDVYRSISNKTIRVNEAVVQLWTTIASWKW